MNSNQEKLAEILSRLITGVPFIFFPNVYRKGSAQREPCDLVWLINNTAIFLYMKESKIYPDIVKREAKTQKIIQNNLNQAEGWIKAWKKGIMLIGKNKFQKFNLPYSSSLNVFIISIYETGIQDSYFHNEFAREQGCTVVVSVPTSALGIMAENNFTPLDLVLLLKKVKPVDYEEVQKIPDIIGSIADYVNKQKLTAEHQYPATHFNNAEYRDLFLENLRFTTEQLAWLNPNGSSSTYQLSELFNDVCLSDFDLLLNYYLSFKKQHSENPNRDWFLTLNLNHYYVALAFTSSQNFTKILNQNTHFIKEMEYSRKDVLTIIMNYENVEQNVFYVPIIYFDRKHASHLEIAASNFLL